MTSIEAWHKSGVAAVLTVAVLLLSFAATAQSDDKTKQARGHYDRGTAFYKQGKFEKALEELMQAYVLDPNPRLVYNIARVHEDAGDYDNAVRFFQNYLTMAPRAKNRRLVRRKIRSLKKAIKRRPKRGFLNVTSTPSASVVRIDGVIVGKTPLNNVPVVTGKVKLSVESEGYHPYETTVRVVGGRTSSIIASLKDRPSAVLIYTEPTGAQVTLLTSPPRALGASPCLTELVRGAHKVRVDAPGHSPKIIEFQKHPGETLKVTVKLDAIQTQSTVQIDSNVAGAEVLIAGRVVGKTPLQAPISVPAGLVDVQVRAFGYVTWMGQVQAVVGQPSRVSAFLQPAASGAIAPTMLVSEPRSNGMRSGGWAMLSIGLVGLAAGGTFTLLAHLDARTADPSNGTFFEVGASTGNPYLVRQDISRQDALELQERAEMFELGSIVSYSVGGAALLTGIILLAVSPEETDAATYRPNIGFSPLQGGGFVQLQLPWK
jgi:hypothetical protein